VTEVKREVIDLRENRSIKRMKENRRKTISREENYDWVCKRRRDRKNIDLGRNHKPLRL
jgi:hypothetical protein